MSARLHNYPWIATCTSPLVHVQALWYMYKPFGTCTSHLVHVHAHAHALASFISTTTKPLPDSATNTDYDTLTMTAFTTTPICNLRRPGAGVRLPCPLLTSLGTRAFRPGKVLNLGHNLEILETVLELLSGCVAVHALWHMYKPFGTCTSPLIHVQALC